MDDKIKSLIYIEFITSFNEEIFKEKKNQIYKIYLDKMDTKEERENIIKLIQKLKDDEENILYMKNF